MNRSTMTETQESPTWRLPAGRALSLPATTRRRWLRVVDGEVWVTVSGTHEQPADDCWLVRDELVALPAGRGAVVEGHPRASFQLIEPAPSGAAAEPWWRAWRAWRRRLSFEPAPPCSAC